MTPATAVTQASKRIIIEPGTCTVSTLVDPVNNHCNRVEYLTPNDALRGRRTAVVSEALRLLGVDSWHAQRLAIKVDSGLAVDRVRASLRWITRNADAYPKDTVAAAQAAMQRKSSGYCNARQFNDQMQCACGLAWDVNDPEPPECGKKK